MAPMLLRRVSMVREQFTVAAVYCCVAAAVCVSSAVILATKNRHRRNQGSRHGDRHHHDQGKNGRPFGREISSRGDRSHVTSRIAPQAEEGFELFDDGDGEQFSPPMKLSGDVQRLMRSFDVDPVRGFLPRVDPLRRFLQEELQPWEAMADALPSLLAVGQARRPLETLPPLPIDILTCHRERMRALLLLCVFAHASVWGNPDIPQDTIPKGIAVPLHALALAEGLPPVLTHTSLILHNWHRLDPLGPVRTDNLACNCHFLGGLDETWFYIATVEIEAKGGGVFGTLLQAQHAIAEAEFTPIPGLSSCPAQATAAAYESAARVVLEALGVAQAGIRSMRESLSRMPVGCHPLIFYQRVRPFLSGWKSNPTLPDGVLYEGVSSDRQKFYGGSAAQSTLFPALDAALEVSHSMHSSNAFLLEMRNYMPPGHRRLLEHLVDPACPSIRRFVQNFPNGAPLASAQNEGNCTHTKAEEMVNGKSVDGEGCRLAGDSNGTVKTVVNGNPNSPIHGADELRDAYNGCLSALRDFRSTHLGIVGSYILQQQKRGVKAGDANSREDFAGGKGTGGTPLLDFLKPLKEDARAAFLEEHGATSAAHET